MQKQVGGQNRCCGDGGDIVGKALALSEDLSSMPRTHVPKSEPGAEHCTHTGTHTAKQQQNPESMWCACAGTEPGLLRTFGKKGNLICSMGSLGKHLQM